MIEAISPRMLVLVKGDGFTRLFLNYVVTKSPYLPIVVFHYALQLGSLRKERMYLVEFFYHNFPLLMREYEEYVSVTFAPEVIPEVGRLVVDLEFNFIFPVARRFSFSSLELPVLAGQVFMNRPDFGPLPH